MFERHVVAPAIDAPDAPSHDSPPHPAASVSGALVSTGRTHLLTVEAVLQARPRLAPVLRAAGCEVRTVRRWDGLLDAIERECVTAILVDLDAANRAAQGAQGAQGAHGAPARAGMVSGTRLVSLLARQARDKRFALIVQTELDFVEIEELIRQGIHALIHPRLRDDAVAACIQHAIEQGILAAHPVRSPAAPPANLGSDEASSAMALWMAEGWLTSGDATIPPAFG